MTAIKALISVCLLTTALAGCDQLGIETPDKVAARQEAEGKAIGGACRHAGRALEDCYEMNRRASKAAIYAGWRDMDGYMRENNIAVVKPSALEDDSTPKVAADTSAKKTAETSAEGKTESPHADKPAKTSTKTS